MNSASISLWSIILVIWASVFMVNPASSADVEFKVLNPDISVTATFAGSSADFSNNAYAVFGDTGLTGQSNNFTTPVGYTYDLGTHLRGSSVSFHDFVADTVETWHSSASLNSDGINHMHYSQFSLPDGTKALFIGFEDIRGGGDLDFNDSMWVITNVSPVPEPSTYAMLLIGLVLVSWTIRRKGKIGGPGMVAS